MRENEWRTCAAGGEADRLVRKQSKGRDWADRADRMQAAIGLGELREYFAAELSKRRPTEEKRALRHYAERAFTRMVVCDIAEERECKRDVIVRVSLEQMARALQRTDGDWFPFAVSMAKTATALDGAWRVSNGPLAHLGLLAEELAREEGPVDGARRVGFAERAKTAGQDGRP